MSKEYEMAIKKPQYQLAWVVDYLRHLPNNGWNNDELMTIDSVCNLIRRGEWQIETSEHISGGAETGEDIAATSRMEKTNSGLNKPTILITSHYLSSLTEAVISKREDQTIFYAIRDAINGILDEQNLHGSKHFDSDPRKKHIED